MARDTADGFFVDPQRSTLEPSCNRNTGETFPSTSEIAAKTVHTEACWGSPVNPSLYTTFNARTFLQPQLNKAAPTPQSTLFCHD